MAENGFGGLPGDQNDEFREMLRKFLSGEGEIDPQQLAGAAGLAADPASVAALIGQLQNALSTTGDGINWSLALDQAKASVRESSKTVTPVERSGLEQALHVAALWLSEVTSVPELSAEPSLLTRTAWVEATMTLWTQLAEPVAMRISDSLAEVLRTEAPEEMRDMLAGADSVMRSIGGTLFALQLGQVVGQLATEVVSGGDVGIPLLDDGRAAVLPQNVAEFGEGLDIPADQVALYLAVRELAHARLFRHAKWLRLQLITQVTEFARGITIDTDRLAELASGLDPSNPEELREAMRSGALIPPKSDAQNLALGRLETMLALIEGWVDVVTARATERLPRANAIAETVRRRRAAGGPAESAFSTLVGLELRPRRLREAAAMWRAVSDAVGDDARDRLWDHPDLVPDSDDVDDPARLIARLRGTGEADVESEELDRALEDLLSDTGPDRPAEDPDARHDDDPGTGPGRPV